MSDVLARAAEVLGAHHAYSDDGGAFDGCACGKFEPWQTPSDIEQYEAHAAHVAQMLADEGLLAESACPQRPTTHETLDSLTARLVAARAATDGYRAEAERLRELLDEAHAKIERMEEL